jgi:UDP-2-acetamido-3-amino-2,3-dideoxy-glucuronate N-acetyltransferase
VVTRDVPDYAMVVGNPGRVAGWMCQCGVKLDLTRDPQPDQDEVCKACGASYSKRNGLVSEAVG